MMKAYVVMIFSLGMAGSPAFAAPETSAVGQLEAVGAAPDAAGQVYDNQAAGRQGSDIVAARGALGAERAATVNKRSPRKTASSSARPPVETSAGSCDGCDRNRAKKKAFDTAFDWVMKPAQKAVASGGTLGAIAAVLYTFVMLVPALVTGLIVAMFS